MRLEALWNRLTDSLWFVPAIITVAYSVAAFLMVQVDIHLIGSLDRRGFWLFAGSAEGARGVLSAIATSIITVTGVVFSVTIVALQLASTQFTPRVLRNFTADRSNQVVLGVFIGTFIYTLLVLRIVRAPMEETTALVPSTSVTLAVLLAVVSIGFLIFFIDHAARSVQASVIIHRVTAETLDTIGHLFTGTEDRALGDELPAAQAAYVTAEKAGYIQGIDAERLDEVAGENGLLIQIRPRMGDYVLPGSTLAILWPAGTAGAVAERIRSAFLLGDERTPHQDPAFGVLELVDIAVKALSPGINDPTTAKICLDHLAQILLAWGRHPPPTTTVRDDDGRLRLVIPAVSFAEITELAFGQVRHFGSAHPHFTVELIGTLRRLGALLPRPRAIQVARHIAAALRAARLQDHEPRDLARIRRAGCDALVQLGLTGGGSPSMPPLRGRSARRPH